MNTSAADPVGPDQPGSGQLHVADVARRTGVTPATIRYYARIGLLHPRRDAQNGYRRFQNEDLHRVGFIRKAQVLGLTIADIRLLLDRIDHREPVCDQVVELLRARLDDIRQTQAELEATRKRIERVLGQWPDSTLEQSSYCPLIDQVDLERVSTQLSNGHENRSTARGIFESA